MKKERIPKLLQHVISQYLQQQVAPAALGALPTLMGVSVSPDLSQAKVYLSFLPMGSEQDSGAFLKQLASHQGALQRYLARRLGNKLRRLPALHLYADEHTREGLAVDRLIQQAHPPHA